MQLVQIKHYKNEDTDEDEVSHTLERDVINSYDGTDTESVNTVDLLRSCQATYVACHSALGRSLRIRVYLLVQMDLEVSS